MDEPSYKSKNTFAFLEGINADIVFHSHGLISETAFDPALGERMTPADRNLIRRADA